MRFFRSERVQTLIQVELSKIILREVEFPNALLTITGVEVDKKLDHARVNVSVIPSSSGPATLAELHKRTGYLQHLLMKKMNIKPMPRIAFALDRGPENAAAVEKALLKK
jgi:ribosome-binding factor A